MLASGLIVALAFVAAILFIWIQRHVTSTKAKTTSITVAPRTPAVKQGRGVKLVQVSPPVKGPEDTHTPPQTDIGIDIIAIHGLDTASPQTWEFKKDDGQRINWLADKHMLPAEVPGTRIFTCDWPAELLETKDSVSLRIEELALSLLQGILGSSRQRSRPILFIASCLGGIILMQALVETKDEYASIREATRGVIFLATPFRGTSFQEVAMWALPGLRVRAAVRGKEVSKLLDYLNAPTFDLTRLVGKFTRLCKSPDHEGFQVFTFYETGYTNLATQASFLSFILPGSKKQLVDMSSATLDCVPNPLPLQRNHSRMNKFCGPLDSDPDYKSVVEVIKRFLLTIQDGTALEQADAWIREKYYDKQRLKIERLSGESLEMSECYINLALVEVHKVDNSERRSEGPSPFSLSERLKLEPLNDDLRVELPDLFQPREMPCGGTKMPRRILIRGRAGVGKTTLCKKIVYDFIHGGMWEDLFKRVVWIRLRELKSFPNDDYSFDRVLRNIFFRQHRQYSKLCTELWRHIEDTQSRDTVFLLDGLDEVPELTMEYKHGNPHPGQDLLKGLLNRPNVIITTRPHATFPTDFRQPDLELDTMGFSESQVFSYLEAVIPEDIDAIEAYLENHRIMKSLVQIPIQLDALCFTWQTSSIWNTDIPDTMTAVYEAMTRELWKKDNERLEKDGIQIIGNASPAETDPFDSTQYESLGYLAFSGLCSNVIEFQPHHRNTLYRFMKKERTSLSFDETFARLSFWRTSDPSNTLPNPSYHFIHLTFQEYFSAKHFSKAWKQEKDVEYIEFDGKRHKKQLVSCQKFVQKHKFTARYNIMWRFVAGILDEDDGQTCRFFEVIEGEPVDLLGSTEQRLVMHCLAEVTQSAQLRTRLENQLSQWLDFELNFRLFSNFLREPEFPGRAINLVLARASMKGKFAILEALEGSRNMSLSKVEFITGCLEMGEFPSTLPLAALRALPRIPLPIRTLNAVVALIDNNYEYTTDWVIDILYCQAPWPSDILRAVMARHESQDSDKDSEIKQRTARALRGDSELSVAVLLQIASWINDRCPPTTKEVLLTLENQRKLNEDIIRIMATVLDDQQQEMRVFAFEMLQERDDLPLDILDTMATHLEAEHRSVYVTLRPSDNILRVLMRRIESQDRSIQQMALQVLCRVDNKRPELPFDDVFHMLAKWLEGEDYGSRQLALTLLYGQQELPERITKAVMAQLENQNQETSHRAFRVLFLQGNSSMRVMDSTIRRLKFGDRDEKRWILAFLEGEYMLPPGVLKAIAQNLNDRDRDTRKTALDTLRALGRSQDFPDDVIVAIAEQFFHANMITRREAAETLAKVWDRQNLPVELLDAIVAQLSSHNPAIREAASDSLVAFGGLHSIFDETLNAIALHLADPESHIRCGAAKTLRGIAHKQVFPDYILSAIAALLEDIQSEIRYESVMTLHTLAENGTFPDHILQPIAALLKDTDKAIQLKALETLGRLGHRQSFAPHILQVIADQLEGPEVEGYMPLIEDVYDRRIPVTPTYRERAAFEALARQSGLPEVTAEAIVARGLASRDPEINRIALYMVRRLPTMSKEIRGRVVALLDDRYDGVRLDAFKALVSHGNLPDDVHPSIAWLIESSFPETQQSVVETLGTCPSLSGELLQAVTRSVYDLDDGVRRAAAEALRGQHQLPDTIFKSAACYSVWLKKSFEEDVCCFIEDGVTYLEWPAGFGKRPLWGDPNELREAILERQVELGMPMGFKEVDRRQ